MKLKKYRRKREIPIGWKEIKLGDVFRTSSGATPLTTELSYYEGGNIPWINSGELASPYIYSTSNYITQKGFDNSSTEIYPKGTILVAMYGATAGKASMLKITACTNQAICAILPNDDYCPEFIKYNIDTLYEHLVGLSSGSARDNLSQAGLKELKLVLPKTKKEQENLIAVLSLLDSKIELNKQINDNLEAMAKQLYDYWFVQFDFPNEEGKPYKSSGGAMVWNENLKREIPQGWVVEKMGKCTNVLLGGTPDTNDNSLWGNGYNWLNSGEVAEFPILKSEKNITPKGLEKSATVLAPKGSVTLSITRHLRPSILCINACINQSVVAILENDKISKEYIYPLLNRDIPRLMSLRTGAQQPHINKETVEAINVVLPPANIMGAYINKAESIYNAIFNNAKEVEELTKQRDELLPLLMNGQATVNYHLSENAKNIRSHFYYV